MASILSSAVTQADSSEFTLTAADVATLSLFSAAAPSLPTDAVAEIKLNTSASAYVVIGRLTAQTPVLVLSAPGTFLVTRKANAVAFGVDKS